MREAETESCCLIISSGDLGTTSCAHNKCKWKNVCLNKENDTAHSRTSESCNFGKAQHFATLFSLLQWDKYIFQCCVVDLPSGFPILLIQLCLNHHKNYFLFAHPIKSTVLNSFKARCSIQTCCKFKSGDVVKSWREKKGKGEGEEHKLVLHHH